MEEMIELIEAALGRRLNPSDANAVIALLTFLARKPTPAEIEVLLEEQDEPTLH